MKAQNGLSLINDGLIPDTSESIGQTEWGLHFQNDDAHNGGKETIHALRHETKAILLGRRFLH
jgi:hypothetical protein